MALLTQREQDISEGLWRLSALHTWLKGSKEIALIFSMCFFLGLAHLLGLCSHAERVLKYYSSAVHLIGFTGRHLERHSLSCWQSVNYVAIVLFHLAHKCLHTVSRIARSKSLMSSWSLEEKLPRGAGAVHAALGYLQNISTFLCRKWKICSER